MNILGIDPGYTSFAATLISYTPHLTIKDLGIRRHVETVFFRFPPPPSKKLNMKSAFVINKRIEEIFVATRDIVLRMNPDAVGIEAYNPIPGKTGSAVKLIGAVTAAKCGIIATGRRPIELGASDLRHSLLGRGGGSKEEVWAAVHEIIVEERWPTHDNNKKEIKEDDLQHLKDSRAIAEVTLREVLDNQKMVGNTFLT